MCSNDLIADITQRISARKDGSVRHAFGCTFFAMPIDCPGCVYDAAIQSCLDDIAAAQS